MNLLVVSTAPVLTTPNGKVAYAPMVTELDLWFNNAERITIVAPTIYNKPLLTSPFKNQEIKIVSVPGLHFGTPLGFLKSIWGVAITKIKLIGAMAKADHIHLRCPGNTTLLACLMQVLFPSKIKTAKYAGNWDPKARQPISYKIQKWILANTFLTKNMQVLVYGQWPNQSKNIKPFFTASYREDEKQNPKIRDYSGTLKFVFVGSLSPGKRPEYAVKLVLELRKMGLDVTLDVYGDGDARSILEKQIEAVNANTFIVLHGNRPKEQIKTAYKQAHFLILPSKSEGWPKAIAEAMFWGCIPMATAISCVPWMLNNGTRGMLLNLKTDAQLIRNFLEDKQRLQTISDQAQSWSRSYTLDVFDSEIKKLLHP